MKTSLYEIADEDLAAFAQMLSLPTYNMEPTNIPDTVRPAGSWLASQAMLVSQLPEGLLWPHVPRNWAVRASQIAKKVAMGVSGGGEMLAAKAAQKGVHLEAHLWPRKAPTVLCPAHQKLNPILIRQMFHYLTRETADCADPVRRHARHRSHKTGRSHRDIRENRHHHRRRHDDGIEACRSRALRDWGNRMMGLCALWCDRETFAELEQGILGCRRSRRGRGSRSMGVAVRRLQYRQRMPHLALPCEVCVLAAVAAQSSALVDLHASMLSRLALEDYGWEREARKGHRVDRAETQQNPHLWAVVQSWIDAFGGDEAGEIRRRGEALARDLFYVRRCEWVRRRRQDQEMHGRHHRHMHPRYHTGGDCSDRNCPARMATKYGHRLPLPFLALGEDSWPWADKMGEEEVMGELEQLRNLGGQQPTEAAETTKAGVPQPQGPILTTCRPPCMTYCQAKELPTPPPEEQERVLMQLMDEMLADQWSWEPSEAAAVDDSAEAGGEAWLQGWDEAYRHEMYETFMPMAGVPEDQDSYYAGATHEAAVPQEPWPAQSQPQPEPQPHKSRRSTTAAKATSSTYSQKTSSTKMPRLDHATQEAASAARNRRAPAVATEKASRESRRPSVAPPKESHRSQAAPSRESRHQSSTATPSTRHSTRPSRTSQSASTPATSSRSRDGTSTVTPDDSISRVAERRRREEERQKWEKERREREERRREREERRREREEQRAREERQTKGKGKEPERRSRAAEPSDKTRASSSRYGAHGGAHDSSRHSSRTSRHYREERTASRVPTDETGTETTARTKWPSGR